MRKKIKPITFTWTDEIREQHLALNLINMLVKIEVRYDLDVVFKEFLTCAEEDDEGDGDILPYAEKWVQATRLLLEPINQSKSDFARLYGSELYDFFIWETSQIKDIHRFLSTLQGLYQPNEGGFYTEEELVQWRIATNSLLIALKSD